MITRLVKLTIDKEKISEFEKIFKENQEHILGSKGCNMAEAFQDIHDPSVFFTHSKWDSEEDLNNYRESELFQGIWSSTKKTFSSRPEAWSLQ